MNMKDYIELEKGGPQTLKPGEDAVPLDLGDFVTGPMRRYRMKCQKCGGKPVATGPETMACSGCGHTSGELADFREQILNPDTVDGTW